MVHITHLVVSLFIFGHPFEMVNGFTISSRDSKLSPPPLSPSVVTEKPGGIDTKTSSQSPHHVPLDISRDSSRSSRSVSLVKREVNPTDEGRVNGLSYDPNVMNMSKRSAAALNKMLLSLPGFYEPSNRYYGNSNENELEATNKERNYLQSPSNLDTFLQNAPQRRGQKDSKKYLRCFFNAVSCF